MQRGRVPCLSFWVYFHNISIVLICSSIHHPECIHFLGTEAAFSFCSCVASNTVRSWSPAQDHSHQNSLVSNPMNSYQTFSLQTYESLKLETRGSVIIRSTGNLWVYTLSELFMGKKEHSVRTGSETFFQLLTRSLGSKLSITHVGNPCLFRVEFMLSLPKWGGCSISCYHLPHFWIPRNSLQAHSNGDIEYFIDRQVLKNWFP